MKYMKWVGVAAAVLLVVSCFTPWYVLPWNGNTLSGVEAGSRFGKPGYWHFVWVFFFLVFSFIQRIWAKQWNVMVAALNLAWMIRNFFALSVCSGGDCPERQTGIWLVLLASVLMMVAALFPDMKVPQTKNR